MIRKDVQSDKNWIIGVLFLLLAVCACICMKFGECNISIMAIVKTLGAHLFSFPDIASIEKVHSIVIWNIRLPRILLAITVGFALATSGTVFQGCFKNPLVEPYILGISSGAAFGASLGIVFPAFFLSVQLLAFFFGFAAVALAYFMARVRGETPVVTLILAGVITGSIFSAFLGIMKYLAQDTALREIVFWLMGGFYYAGWGDVAVILPIVAVCFIIIWFSGWQINVLSMGDQEAKSLGINAEKTKACLILLATLMTAVSVSAVGIIAWVGLMMPHATRMVTGPDHRIVIPCAGILGGIYLIICDTLARTMISTEIPIGIITSILGAPYLIFLIRTKGRKAFGG